MGVNGLHHDIDGSLGLHGGNGFGDQLEAVGADDVHAEDLAVLLVGDDLDEAFVLAEDGGAAIACPIVRNRTTAAPIPRLIQRLTLRPA